MRSNSIAGIARHQTVPSHSPGAMQSAVNSATHGLQMIDSNRTQPERLRPNFSERPIDGFTPSHASQTPLKTATKETRKATINTTMVTSRPSATETDGSSEEEVEKGSSVGASRKAESSIDAISRMKRIHTGVDTTNREPSSGFQLRVTTLTPASRISPTESGRSEEDATAANLAG